MARRGRPPIFGKAMTNAEHQARWRKSQRALNGLYGFDIEAIKDQGKSIRKALAEMTVGPDQISPRSNRTRGQ